LPLHPPDTPSQAFLYVEFEFNRDSKGIAIEEEFADGVTLFAVFHMPTVPPPVPPPPRMPFYCIARSAADKMAVHCLICFLQMSSSTLSMAPLALIHMGRVLYCECRIGLGSGCGGGGSVNHNDNNSAVPSGADLRLGRCPWLTITVIVAGWIRDNDDLSGIWEVDGTRPPPQAGEAEGAATPTRFLQDNVGLAQCCHCCRRSRQGWG
jgi:hypothetical protein